MTKFASNLLAESKSWSSAYLQYQTGKKREGYRSYAFLEDDDDKSFYQLALTSFDGICYIGCGGKIDVLSVFQKLSDENQERGNLFFVDRDTERLPFVHEEQVLRTTMYSWESYVCSPQYVGWLLQRKLEPNLSIEEAFEIQQAWSSTIGAFKGVLDKHTALCRTAFVIDHSLGMSEVPIALGALANGPALQPGPLSLDWREERIERALDLGATEADVERREAYFDKLDTAQFSRGKTLFMLLRVFTRHTMQRLEREFRGQANSAKMWIEAMPWTDPALDFVREYATRRLAGL